MSDKSDSIQASEIEQDIRDTEREIIDLEREAIHFEATPQCSKDYRVNFMKANNRRDGIDKRTKFIARLKEILAERGATR